MLIVKHNNPSKKVWGKTCKKKKINSSLETSGWESLPEIVVPKDIWGIKGVKRAKQGCCRKGKRIF